MANSGEKTPPNEDAQSAEQETTADPAPQPGAESSPVIELGNTSKGCWKLTADGTRTDLSPEAWRKELTRLFSRSANRQAG